MPECFYFNNCCFWARATAYHATEIGNVAKRMHCSVTADKTKTIVSVKVNYRGTPPYNFLAHLQCTLKFACKFILCYLH